MAIFAVFILWIITAERFLW